MPDRAVRRCAGAYAAPAYAEAPGSSPAVPAAVASGAVTTFSGAFATSFVAAAFWVAVAML